MAGEYIYNWLKLKRKMWLKAYKKEELQLYLHRRMNRQIKYIKWEHTKILTGDQEDPLDEGFAAAAAKSLQSCPTLCDPIDSSHQAPLSLGFSRQEHWNGLPLPSSMHESEEWKWSHSVMSNSLRPHGLQPTRLLHSWEFPGKSTGVGCHCLLQDEGFREVLFSFSMSEFF